MKLTRELIMAGRTEAGAWNRHQIEALGAPWPLVNGWICRLEGKTVSDQQYAEFLRLATIPVKQRRAAAKAEGTMTLF